MASINITEFGGIVPRRGASLLNDSEATVARNVDLQSGELRAWKAPAVICEAPSGTKTIFKHHGHGDEVWLTFNKDVDICYGPIADDDDGRIYYTENGVCKKTDFSMSKGSGVGPFPENWLYMGVAYPAAAPTVSSDTSGATEQQIEDRVYCYTYVSEFGDIIEESAPSPGASCRCKMSDGTVNISGFIDPPTDHYNITKIRIYRSVTGSSTIVFMLVDQINLVNHRMPASGTSLNGVAFSNSTYPDTRLNTQLGKDLDSEYYTPPPTGLAGLVSMPNGFFAGFINNQLWFSEPYLPHAWPSTYMLTVDSPIVGLGVYGNTLVVCTERQPYTVAGTHPSSVSQEKQPMMQPCISKQSIAYDQYGVIYASPYGLVALAGGQMDVFTRPLLTSDDWMKYAPNTMVATMYNNKYIAAYKTTDGGRALVFSRGDTPALTELDLRMDCAHVERGTGVMYYFDNEENVIYQMASSEINKETYNWKSKLFVFPYWTNFSVMKVTADFKGDFDSEAYIRERNRILQYNSDVFGDRSSCVGGCIGDACIGGNPSGVALTTDDQDGHIIGGCILKAVPEKYDVRSMTVTLLADGEARISKTVHDHRAIRVPKVKAHEWQVLVTGEVDVRSISIASSMSELGGPAP